MPQQSVAFYTLGCKLNYSESSTLGRSMQDVGFAIRPFHEKADVYVINTCSVTEHADKKCRKVVKQALRIAPQARVVIVGCYAQLKPAEIAAIEGVDLVLGAAEKFELVKHIAELMATSAEIKKGQFIASDIKDVSVFNASWSIGERTRTFLKIQDGCDYSCSFCTIPLARGNSRSDTIAHVVHNAEMIAAQGIREIVLTGVNIGDFGKQNTLGKEEDFLQLIKALDQVEGIERFRISSIEPNLLNNAIIEYVSRSSKFVPHFHIPLQSGSDKILKLMRRRYLRTLYADRITTIRKRMPHACIGVDVITGFPGETDADFLDTYHFLNELEISYLHVFTYSERAHTLAVEMPDVVPQKIREERTQQLRNLSEKKKRAFYTQFENTVRPVLFEAENDGAEMFGFTDNYIRVKTEYDPLLVNEIVAVRLCSITPSGDMQGQIIAEETFPVEQEHANMHAH